MKIEVFSDDESTARAAAKYIAAEADAAVAARDRFVMAVSGGRTPWIMLRALASEELPWEHVHVVQVDERVAPTGNSDRNPTPLLDFSEDGAPPRTASYKVAASSLVVLLRSRNRSVRKERGDL